jgi:hypothetical protein
MNVTYVLTVQSRFLNSSDMITRVENIDISPVRSERQKDFSVISDTTALDAGSTTDVQRTIVATLTADFESRFPTLSDKQAALTGVFKNFFSMNLPGVFTESINIA